VTCEGQTGRPSWLAGYIMAGGTSSRFGRDKALVEIDGKPMLARMIELMRGLTTRVKTVGPAKKYAEFGVEMVADRWPGEGPLGGIITALLDAVSAPAQREARRQPGVTSLPRASRGQELLGWCLIVSCDMPFLTSDWLTYLAERAAKSSAQAVLPWSAQGAEPLCACYRTDAAGPLQAAFETGVRKITEALKHVSVEMLDEGEWKRFDSAGQLFWNMNTAADFEKVRRVWEVERQ